MLVDVIAPDSPAVRAKGTRVELAECFAGSVIAAWEVPLFLLPQVLQQAHDFVTEYWEQVSQET